jgi:hypothetical protein
MEMKEKKSFEEISHLYFHWRKIYCPGSGIICFSHISVNQSFPGLQIINNR